jgi:hypothetical protein
MAARALIKSCPGINPSVIESLIKSNYLNVEPLVPLVTVSQLFAILTSRSTHRQKFIQLCKINEVDVALDYFRCWEKNIKLNEINMVENIIEILGTTRNIDLCKFLQEKSGADMHQDNDYQLYAIILERENPDVYHLFIEAFGIKYKYLLFDVMNELIYRNTPKSNERIDTLMTYYGHEVKEHFFKKTITDKATAARNVYIANKFMG